VAPRTVVVVLSIFVTWSGCSSGGGSVDLGPDLSGVDQAQPPPDLFEPDLIPLASPPDLAGVDLTGYPAAHAPLPQVPKHHDALLKNMRLVTVTYDDDPNRAAAEAFGNFIFGSSYYKLFTTEYGFGGGMQVATVHVPGPAPLTQSTVDLLNQLDMLLDAGTAPAPLDTADDQVVYAFWIPDGSKIDDGTNGRSCTDYLGFHSTSIYAGQHFPFMVIADCGAVLVDATATAAHEVIETASDPYGPPLDGYYLDSPLPDHWYADTGNEIADLCSDENYTYEGGFALQPIWSNAAAAAGKAPCLPETSWPYYNLDVSPATVPTVAAGGTVSFTLTGWAFSPRADWSLDYSVSTYSDLTDTQMKPMFSSKKINNGKSVMLTLTVPAGAASGSVGAVDVISAQMNSRGRPVAFKVQ
jgi:hypothetical protein